MSLLDVRYQILLAAIIVVVMYTLSVKPLSKNFPPGPWALPVFGNIFSLNMKKPYKTLLQLQQKYGPVFNIQLGLRKMVVLCGYETVKEALITQAEQFAGRPIIPIFHQITKGNGIIFGHGESWKTMRRFTLSVLRDLGMGRKSVEEKIIEESEHLLKLFEAYGNEPFQTRIPVTAAVSNIIVSLIRGDRLDYEDNVFKQLLIFNTENFKLVGHTLIQLYNMYPIFHPLPGPHHKIIKQQDSIQTFFKKVFFQHREVLDKDNPHSFIDAFMIKQEEEKDNPSSYFHEDNLIFTITNLFVAGTETTSTTLTWAILLMMKYPHIQKKVHDEIDNVIGEPAPRIQHRQMMPFTDAVIHETQRFADIFPMDLPHETTTDVNFREYFIPKGTYIIPLLSSVHRDPNHWTKPDEFYPEHFLDNKGKFLKKEAFMAFSAGRRICVGETLAKMELFIFFASLMQRFSFHTPVGMTEDDLDLSACGGFSLNPPPLLVRAVPRSSHA